MTKEKLDVVWDNVFLRCKKLAKKLAEHYDEGLMNQEDRATESDDSTDSASVVSDEEKVR